MKQFIILIFALATVVACKKENKEAIDQISTVPNTEVVEEVIDAVVEEKQSAGALKAELKAKGYETFDYVDKKTQDTVIMQKYFMAFLKTGPIRSQNEEVDKGLQEEHLEHLSRMYDEGFADLIGPFGDDGDIRGIAVYNVPTKKMADSLANLDPMVQAGRLKIEMHPWWCAKGQSLR
ncbi:YciI family protein [Lacinutrix sp. MEBiC02595]